MSTPPASSDYLLLIRGTHWDKDLSPEEIQKVMSNWSAWFEDLTRRDKIKGAQPLAPEGKIVAGKKGHLVADGPFAESKEAIAGYFLLQVRDLAEALEIAKSNPALEYGITIEVRPVIAQCPTMQRANALAQAEV
ncbi:MAG: DGPFAETKE family protein [Desulfatitalea sp. BRH_c12]|nr:MAG: DGPFAETKE family protein [Desulfatitalea sp. BRH_c12]